MTAEVVIEDALRAGDVVVGGGGSGGAHDGFGAHGIAVVRVAVIVIPFSIVIIHLHAVPVPVRLRVDFTPWIPVCERAAAVVH